MIRRRGKLKADKATTLEVARDMSVLVDNKKFQRLMQLWSLRRSNLIEKMKKTPSIEAIHELIGFDLATSEPEWWLKYLTEEESAYEHPTGGN